mmetsp:Transcript_1539/g.4996  ORF Transcript_1539/g.4996 Transcript_1539/m.4996 type:complete len:292 (-) Transcript_1539:865-1740(-)
MRTATRPCARPILQQGPPSPVHERCASRPRPGRAAPVGRTGGLHSTGHVRQEGGPREALGSPGERELCREGVVVRRGSAGAAAHGRDTPLLQLPHCLLLRADPILHNEVSAGGRAGLRAAGVPHGAPQPGAPATRHGELHLRGGHPGLGDHRPQPLAAAGGLARDTLGPEPRVARRAPGFLGPAPALTNGHWRDRDHLPFHPPGWHLGTLSPAVDLLPHSSLDCGCGVCLRRRDHDSQQERSQQHAPPRAAGPDAGVRIHWIRGRAAPQRVGKLRHAQRFHRQPLLQDLCV